MLRLIGLFAALWGSAVLAQDSAHKLVLRSPKVGDKFQETRTEVQTQTITINAMGQTQSRTGESTTELVYVEEVQGVTEGVRKPTKLKRTYSKAVQKVDGKERELVAAGTTILITNQKDKHSYIVDEQDLPVGPMLQLLKREFEQNTKASHEDFLPKMAVKANDSWKIETEKLAEDLQQSGLIVDAKTARASGKLNSLDSKTGNGTMIVDLEFPISKFKNGPMETPVKEGLLKVKFEYSGNLNGTSGAYTGKVSAVSSLTIEQPQGTIVIENNSVRTEQAKPVAKTPEK